MPGRNSADHLLLDQIHCRAICDEIGERLCEVLRREVTEMPPYLRRLVKRFAELEHVPAPSIVPSIDDIRFQVDTEILESALGG